MTDIKYDPEIYIIVKREENTEDNIDKWEVPTENSGGTVGYGVDFYGKHKYMNKWTHKFKIGNETGMPFSTLCDLKGDDAKKWIEENKPYISKENADLLSNEVMQEFSEVIRLIFRLNPHRDVEVFAVALSVHYQFYFKNCPKFFGIKKGKLNECGDVGNISSNRGVLQFAKASAKYDAIKYLEDDKAKIEKEKHKAMMIECLKAMIAELLDFNGNGEPSMFQSRREREANHLKIALDRLEQSND